MIPFSGAVLNTLVITDLSHLDTLHLEGKCIITNAVRTESCISVSSARQAPSVTADKYRVRTRASSRQSDRPSRVIMVINGHE